MKKDKVIWFEKPAHDLLTEVVRQGARQLLEAAVEAEGDEVGADGGKDQPGGADGLAAGERQDPPRGGAGEGEQRPEDLGEHEVRWDGVGDSGNRVRGAGKSAVPHPERSEGPCREKVRAIPRQGASLRSG